MFSRPPRFLNEDAEAWQIACWSWLLQGDESRNAFIGSPLITPTAEFFPALGDIDGHARAAAVFDRVKTYCGLEAWPVELVAQRDMTDQAGGAPIFDDRPCAGMFMKQEDGRAFISYDPSQLKRPADLVATFAHELGHYYHTSFSELPPGGEDLLEPATDLTAAYFGFGIFGANTSCSHEIGSFYQRIGKTGYLSENEWILSLAIFLHLRKVPAETAEPHLKPHLRRSLGKALTYLERSGLTAPLAEMIN